MSANRRADAERASNTINKFKFMKTGDGVIVCLCNDEILAASRSVHS